MGQDQHPEATNTAMDTFGESHEDIRDTQFLKAIHTAMDAVEEEKNMWDDPLPSLEILEAAMEEVPRCAYTKRKNPLLYIVI